MLMQLLRLLPPEDAHAITIEALKLGLGPNLKNKSDLGITLFGKQIRNPIGLSGGADKKAAALAGWSKMGFGIVEAGSVTLRPRTGNPQPRMWRIKSSARAVVPTSSQEGGTERMAYEYNSVINWLGMPGEGLDPFIKNLAAFQNHPARKNLCVGASIASPDGVMDEFKILAAAVAPYVDYITLNASCPNVNHDDHALEDTASAQIKSAKIGAGDVPVLLKLGPTADAQSLGRMVRAALAARVDGFVATNTVPFASSVILANKISPWPSHDGKEVGGYSGPQLLDISTRMVREIRKLVPADMPIIGVGGIQSGADAKRMLASGANAVQLYTGLIYKGPNLLNEIAATL